MKRISDSIPARYDDLYYPFFAMKQVVLLGLILVLSEVNSSGGPGIIGASAASASSSSSIVSHNRLFSDEKLRRYDPYDDDGYLPPNGKESSSIKRPAGDIDSRLERFGAASGRPLSASVKDLGDVRDHSGCPIEFGGRCRCGEDYLNKRFGQKFVVNCTDAGFSSPEVLQSLPENTEALIFTGNSLPSLPANLFGNSKTYPHLVYIDLSSNGIEAILGKTFHRVNATEMLILNNNMISRSTLLNHKRIFSNFVNLKYLMLGSAFGSNPDLLSDLSEVFIESNLTALEKIHLEHNGIDYINDPDVFCKLTAIQDIHLSQNNLSDLNLDLTCLNKVRYVDLTYNNIRTIGENSGIWKLLQEKNLQGDQIHVNLYENPFVCDCRLDRFLQLLQNWTRADPDVIPFREKLTCEDGFPKNNTKMPLMLVTFTDCPLLEASNYDSTAVSITAWILGLLLLTGIVYFLYTNKNVLCRPVSPLHQTTTQGVKYTTIQEEEAEVAHV